MAKPLTSIRNIGPATATALKAAGIPTAEALHDIGPTEAYRRLLANGHAPHFIGFYVLVMGLQGRPWNDCRGAEKEALRREFDALVAQSGARRKPAGQSLIDIELDAIGVRFPSP